MPVEIFPSITIRSGRVVRLSQSPGGELVYEEDPAALAERFAWQGARWLHLVDLDRAFGDGNNADLVQRIVQRVGSYVQIQLGGGMRSMARIREALDLEVARILIGSAAVTDPHLVSEAVRLGGVNRVGIGLDARRGYTVIRGWQEASPHRAQDIAEQVVAAGVRIIVYTDISRDGTYRGPDMSGAVMLQDAGAGVIVSGGIGTLEEIEQLRAAGLAGAVIGRALYEKRFTIAEALRAAGVTA